MPIKKKSNTKKYEIYYLEVCEIENKLNNRIENCMPTEQRNTLLKRFTFLTKKMNILQPKIEEIQFNEFLGSMLCMDYDVFLDGEIDTKYDLELF